LGTHHDARAAKSSTAKARSGREQCPHIALSHVSCSALKCQRRHNSDKPDVVPAPAGTLLRVFRLAADAVTSRLSPPTSRPPSMRKSDSSTVDSTARPACDERGRPQLQTLLEWTRRGVASDQTYLCSGVQIGLRPSLSAKNPGEELCLHRSYRCTSVTKRRLPSRRIWRE